jgi:hypothetical protein
MSSRDIDSLSNALSTGVIVAIVIGSIIGLALCIGSIIIIVCIIKHCNRPSRLGTQGMVLQQPNSYPHSWTANYPPDITSVANYPPAYPSLPPPYTASASDYTKPPYT